MSRAYLGTDYAKAYRVLVALRIVFAFLGTGYIHPDEYFQNGEVTAGPEIRISSSNISDKYSF